MAATFTITTTGFPAMTRSDIRNAKRSSMWDVANQWHIRFRPIHFTPRGARRYRYVPRITKVITQGLVRFSKSGRPRAPSGDPLVWSGRSRLLSQAKKIRATSKWSRVTSPVRALNFAPKGNPRLQGGQMVREYRTKVPSEWATLNKVASKSVARELNISKRRVVTRIQ